MAEILLTSNPQLVILPDGLDSTLVISPTHPMFGGSRRIFFIEVKDSAGVQFNSMGAVSGDSPEYITGDKVPPITAGPDHPVHVKGDASDEILVGFING